MTIRTSQNERSHYTASVRGKARQRLQSLIWMNDQRTLWKVWTSSTMRPPSYHSRWATTAITLQSHSNWKSEVEVRLLEIIRMPDEEGNTEYWKLNKPYMGWASSVNMAPFALACFISRGTAPIARALWAWVSIRLCMGPLFLRTCWQLQTPSKT